MTDNGRWTHKSVGQALTLDLGELKHVTLTQLFGQRYAADNVLGRALRAGYQELLRNSFVPHAKHCRFEGQLPLITASHLVCLHVSSYQALHPVLVCALLACLSSS